MADKRSKARAALVTKYLWWKWHFNADGFVWVQHPQTGVNRVIGKI